MIAGVSEGELLTVFIILVVLIVLGILIIPNDWDWFD